MTKISAVPTSSAPLLDERSGDDPDLASYLRIEEPELEPGGLELSPERSEQRGLDPLMDAQLPRNTALVGWPSWVVAS